MSANEKYKTNHMLPISGTQQTKETTGDPSRTGSTALALSETSLLSGDLQKLDETVKAMMLTSENVLQNKRHAKICKVYGKEGQTADIMRHIEANHLEGVFVPCNLCDFVTRSRNTLRLHVSRNHKNID